MKDKPPISQLWASPVVSATSRCGWHAARLPAVSLSEAVLLSNIMFGVPALQGVSVDDVKSKLTEAGGPQTNATQADYVGSCPPFLHASVLPIARCRDPPLSALAAGQVPR